MAQTNGSKGRITGRVKWFNDDKGYGFISPDAGDKDAFVHFSAIVTDDRRKTLADGQRVEYETEMSDKGLKAVNVLPIEEDE